MKKISLTAYLLAVCLLLSACSSIPITPNTTDQALPASDYHEEAPIGDAELSYTEAFTLYYPSFDGISLETVQQNLTFSLSCPKTESIVREMIAYTGSGTADKLGGEVHLSLYGSNPVEVSRDTVTIQLGASALQLDRERLYLVGQAFANTLCQLENISYVNLLIAGKAVGLDTAGTLPMGVFTATQEKDIASLYQQRLERRQKPGDESLGEAFPSNVCLYFPLSEMKALVCDTQSLSFENQTVYEIVRKILNRLSLGLQSENVASPELPLLCDFLTVIPTILTSKEAEGDILQLDFAQNLLEMLEAYQVDEETAMASLCQSFCSFLPGLVGIRVSIDGSPVKEPEESTNSKEHGSLYLRSTCEIPVYDYAKLYFADQEGNLVSCLRPMAFRDTGNPRKLLIELGKGPQTGDMPSGLLPVVSENVLTDAHILGISLRDSSLLCNFSPSLSADGFDEMSSEEEKLFCYAMVNTLCGLDKVKTVAYFRSSRQFEGFSGEISWLGLFYPLL